MDTSNHSQFRRGRMGKLSIVESAAKNPTASLVVMALVATPLVTACDDTPTTAYCAIPDGDSNIVLDQNDPRCNNNQPNGLVGGNGAYGSGYHGGGSNIIIVNGSGPQYMPGQRIPQSSVYDRFPSSDVGRRGSYGLPASGGFKGGFTTSVRGGVGGGSVGHGGSSGG